MSRSQTNVRDALSPFADTFETVANESEDLETSDALHALAAIANGENVPEDVANRIKDRAENGGTGQ